MRDVKDVHTAVCRQLPSTLLCGERGGWWTYESEVSSSSIRRISSMCGWWCWASEASVLLGLCGPLAFNPNPFPYGEGLSSRSATVKDAFGLYDRYQPPTVAGWRRPASSRAAHSAHSAPLTTGRYAARSASPPRALISRAHALGQPVVRTTRSHFT